jgi:hypothetical protein
MKKAISLLMLLLLPLGLVVYGCGDSDKSTATTSAGSGQSSTMTTSTGGGQTTISHDSTTVTVGSSSDITWNDVPVYPGADSVHEASWSLPPTDEHEYAEAEWRYFEVGASTDDVGSFYESKMPDNGWEEVMNFDMAETKYFLYTKDNETQAAMVWVSTNDNKTVFALMRASK